MTDLGSLAFQLSRELDACENYQDVGFMFQQSIKHVSMTCSASGMVTGPKAVSENPFHFINWPPEWLQLYQSSGFILKDPVPRHAMLSGATATWTEIVQNLPKNDPGREVVAAANLFGFTEGAVVPLRNDRGDLGLVSIGGPRGGLKPDEVEFLKVISSAAFFACDRMSDPTLQNRSPSLFTLREQECIKLLHLGFTDAEIATALGISIVTARSHIENARRKVNARSRTHLVSITSQGLSLPAPEPDAQELRARRRPSR